MGLDGSQLVHRDAGQHYRTSRAAGRDLGISKLLATAQYIRDETPLNPDLHDVFTRKSQFSVIQRRLGG